MADIHTIFNEVDELRGRLSAIMVNYPDTEVRMKPAIDVLDVLLTKPVESTIGEAVEELIDLRTYFADLIKRHADLEKPFRKPIDLIDRLLGPANEAVH